MTVDQTVPTRSHEAAPAEPRRRRPNWRRVPAWLLTALACLLVLYALVAPNDVNKLTLTSLLRLPAEALAVVALVLVLPARPGRIVAGVAGGLLGLLTILKIIDMGFIAVLYRGFDPVLDWTFLSAGVDYVAVTAGRFAAIAAVVGAVLLIIGLIGGMTLAALRLTRIARQHRRVAVPAVKALVVAWVVCAFLGVQLAPDLPVASWTAAQYGYEHARQVPAAIQDAKNFAAEASVDAFRGTPGEKLLTALRGKDVVITFVESYGRTALDNPELAPAIGPVLDAGTSRLRAAGYDSRSAFLTSSTYGGGSWLAHATLDSGLWINNQSRYRHLVASDRLTLIQAFRKAGWRTVGVEPAVIQAYPEGQFFGYDKVYAAKDLGYQGTRFSYATMPDQYLLSAFQRNERARPHAPVMAQIVTLTSHAPWSPVPDPIDWTDVGDGRVFDTMAGANAPPESIFSTNPERVRANYTRSLQYALNNVVSYLETFGDDNLVMIFLGDHQPATVVTGQGASHDVPISIVAKDPAVLRQISGWGWESGLKPGPDAPLWRMDQFRDRFLTAFGAPLPRQ